MTEFDSTWKQILYRYILGLDLETGRFGGGHWFSVIASAHLAGACISVHHFFSFAWNTDGLIRYSVSARGVWNDCGMIGKWQVIVFSLI